MVPLFDFIVGQGLKLNNINVKIFLSFFPQKRKSINRRAKSAILEKN